MAGPVSPRDSGSIPEDPVSDSSSKNPLSPLDAKVDSVSREAVKPDSEIKTETPLRDRVKSVSSSIQELFSDSVQQVRHLSGRLQKLFQKTPNKRGDNFVMVSDLNNEFELTEDTVKSRSVREEGNSSADKDIAGSSGSGDSALEEETFFNVSQWETGRNHIYQSIIDLEGSDEDLLKKSSRDVATSTEDIEAPLSPEAQAEADLLLGSLQFKGSAPIQGECCCSKACKNMLKVLSDLVSSISKLFRKLIAWIRGLIHRQSYDLEPPTNFKRRNAKYWKNTSRLDLTDFKRSNDLEVGSSIGDKDIVYADIMHPNQPSTSKEEGLQKCLEELIIAEQGISDLSMKLSYVVKQTEDISNSPDGETGTSSDALERELSTQTQKLQKLLKHLRAQLMQLRTMEFSSVLSGPEG